MKKIFSIILFISLINLFSMQAQAGMLTFVQATNANSNAKKAQKEVEDLSNNIVELKKEVKEIKKQIEKILELLEKQHEKTKENTKW